VAIHHGERAAEVLLVQRYGPPVRQFLQGKVSCPAAVDDLFQDCFLLAITHLRDGRVRTTDDVASFVIGIARRLLLAYVRSKVQARGVLCDPHELDALPAEETSPEEAAERAIVRALVRARVDDLEIPRDREALVRRYLLDEDTGTVARELRVSEREVRVVLCRARERLRSACADLRGSSHR
jgi:RNA polymerase sigma factor (sigma-70 family)